MPHFPVLFISLFCFWFLLSGFWDNTLLLIFGAVSSTFVVWLDVNLKKQNSLDFDFGFSIRFPIYMIWLFGQIWKANVDTAKRIWFPSIYPISPAVTQLKMSQATDIGKTVYANSITITPGTVSMNIEGNYLIVHALAKESIEELQDGEMDKRVTKLESIK